MINFIEHLEGLIVSKIAVARGVLTLFRLEAKLAGLNIVPLLTSLAVLIALCLSTWLTVMVLIGYLITLLIGPLLAMITVLLLNAVALFFVGISLSSCIKQMSFEKTRALLSNQQSEGSHELAKRTTKIH
ncbi:hypothetical protein [Legionella brunensis]|uniref:Phage holin family protein n=1 Tax=Legionella brunensis TaxID=29422 RepID=A0A0W0SSU3_9GAMM|nr:hypothetical protein [Legionella brunensis]KTC86285.1 hypothetical protein Lbru_0779 [Legionella brunensis]